MQNTLFDAFSVDSERIRVGILAISDSANLLEDVGPGAWKRIGGESIEQALPEEQFALLRMLVMPGGNVAEIAHILRDWCDAPNPAYRCRLILTVGGDGNTERDIVPEATQLVVEQEALDIVERLWQVCVEQVSRSAEPGSTQLLPQMESRAVAGVRNRTLIVNISSCYADPGVAVTALLPLLASAFEEIDR